MLIPSRLVPVAFLVAAGAFAAGAEPPQLVKSVAPPSTATRIRLPVAEDAQTFAHLKATMPNPKKRGETVPVRVLIDTLPNMGLVSLKTWKDWGLEVPANRVGVLPELTVTAAQLAPKPAKGGDVEYRLTNVKVNIIEAPAGADVAHGCDLWLSLRDLTGGTDRAFEPRFYFADQFIELTAPNGALRRLGTGDVTVPDPKATEGELVPASGALRGAIPVFAFASLNGRTEYPTATGRTEKVNVMVSSITNYPVPGIVMTVNTARGCGVELDKVPGDGEAVLGKVKELRLALQTGGDLKAQKDFVLKDLTVSVLNEKSQSGVWLGPRFVEEYFTDGVYGCGGDGVWRLCGRVKPDLLHDVKTRTAPKKP